MKSRDVYDMRGRRRLARIFAQVLLITLLVGMMQIPASAAENECRTSSPPSAAYTVTVCITAPADGAIVSGVRTVTATVSVTPAATNPGIARMVFYLGGEYLLTDSRPPSASTCQPPNGWMALACLSSRR